MGITSRRNEVDTFPSPCAADSLHNLTPSLAVQAYDGNDDEDNVINHLDIAEGLKDALVTYGFKERISHHVLFGS